MRTPSCVVLTLSILTMVACIGPEKKTFGEIKDENKKNSPRSEVDLTLDARLSDQEREFETTPDEGNDSVGKDGSQGSRSSEGGQYSENVSFEMIIMKDTIHKDDPEDFIDKSVTSSEEVFEKTCNNLRVDPPNKNFLEEQDIGFDPKEDQIDRIFNMQPDWRDPHDALGTFNGNSGPNIQNKVGKMNGNETFDLLSADELYYLRKTFLDLLSGMHPLDDEQNKYGITFSLTYEHYLDVMKLLRDENVSAELILRSVSEVFQTTSVPRRTLWEETYALLFTYSSLGLHLVWLCLFVSVLLVVRVFHKRLVYELMKLKNELLMLKRHEQQQHSNQQRRSLHKEKLQEQQIDVIKVPEKHDQGKHGRKNGESLKPVHLRHEERGVKNKKTKDHLIKRQSQSMSKFDHVTRRKKHNNNNNSNVSKDQNQRNLDLRVAEFEKNLKRQSGFIREVEIVGPSKRDYRWNECTHETFVHNERPGDEIMYWKPLQKSKSVEEVQVDFLD